MSKDSINPSGRASPKGKAAGGRKSAERFAKLTLEELDDVDNPQERERLFGEAAERMKKSIEELHLRDAVNAKHIQRLRGEIGNLKERIGNVEVDLKSTEKTKELDSNYLLQQEEVLARAKNKMRKEADTSKLSKEIKRTEDSNKRMKGELKQDLLTFIADGGYMEQTKDSIEETIAYSHA